MHNGIYSDLREVLQQYNDGMPDEKVKMKNGLATKKSGMIGGIRLEESDMDDLENFMKTLHSYR